MTEIEAGRHPPRKTKSAVFSVRFPGDELWEVRRAAQAADVSVGEFIRQAALTRARSSAVPAAFAGAVGRALTAMYHDFAAVPAPAMDTPREGRVQIDSEGTWWILFDFPKAAQALSDQSLEDMLVWLHPDGNLRTGPMHQHLDQPTQGGVPPTEGATS